MADEERPEEFENFEDLTKRLLTVSKEDLDRQRKGAKNPPDKGVGKSAILD